ncbi:MAG: hypothetical protein ACW98D_11280 [Promethearchaeota archaeon]|jgi:hypothetical protein
MFYQQNPMYAIIVIGVCAVGYILIKSRRSGSGISGFFKGKTPQTNTNMDDLITLMMLQQLTNNSNSRIERPDELENNDHENHIEKVKQEALALFDD